MSIKCTKTVRCDVYNIARVFQEIDRLVRLQGGIIVSPIKSEQADVYELHCLGGYEEVNHLDSLCFILDTNYYCLRSIPSNQVLGYAKIPAEQIEFTPYWSEPIAYYEGVYTMCVQDLPDGAGFHTIVDRNTIRQYAFSLLNYLKNAEPTKRISDEGITTPPPTYLYKI